MFRKTFSVKMLSDNNCVLCLVLPLLILLALTKGTAEAQELRPPALDFSKHRLVQPIVHHGRTKRQISTTRDTSGAHHSEVTVRIPIEDQEYSLDLRLNQDLVTDNHVLRYQKNGKTVVYKPKKEDIDLICQYSGTVRGKPGSWVAVSTCHGVRGIFFDGARMKYIEPAEGSNIQSNHYIYDHSDLNNDYHCGYVGGVTNNASNDPQVYQKYHSEQDGQRSRISRYKRYAPDTEVRGPYNANKLSRYVELVLVADNGEYKANGENLQAVYQYMKDVANIVNSVYSPLNIFIALVGVVVWTETDEIILKANADETLKNFVNYRKSALVKDIPNDNAQLLTRQKFNDGVVGYAWNGPICSNTQSGGVATNHSKVIGLVASTIAHEMGHNFGIGHDSDDLCKCPDANCIMRPILRAYAPIHWSSCSLSWLTLAFERGMDYCLRNKPKRLFDSPTCGNGFTEPGEQCDCGTMADPRSHNPCHACCDPDTCMLRSNATCGAGMCCDLQTCRPKSAGTVCRSADRECDLPEYCTGHSEYCPDDFYKMDTTDCGKGNETAHCVKGSCRSHTDQCRLLWGTTGESSHDNCYVGINVKGNGGGNCGYDHLNQRYKPCAARDAMCGTLQCRHLNVRLEVGTDSISTLYNGYAYTNDAVIPCRAAVIDMGLSDVDPGMVPDGAKCGDDMMCYKHQCVPVSSLRDSIATLETSVCPSGCSGHGVCNSAGHCHCEAGFGPPLCAFPGPGGSYDSGPATDPTIQHNFMVAMYVIFLGIVPLISLVLLLINYSRRNTLIFWRKPRKSYVDNRNGCTKPNTKSKFAKFQDGISSLRKQLSLKRNPSAHSIDNICTDPPQPEGPIYSNLEELKAIQKTSNAISVPDKNVAGEPLKKPVKKINKDDIQIMNHTDIKVIKVYRPPVRPKPNLSNLPKGNKPNVVIIKQGLKYTTNGMVANSQHRMLDVGNNSSLHGNVGKFGKNANVGENANVHRVQK